jgi:hypothetical protein
VSRSAKVGKYGVLRNSAERGTTPSLVADEGLAKSPGPTMPRGAARKWSAALFR